MVSTVLPAILAATGQQRYRSLRRSIHRSMSWLKHVVIPLLPVFAAFSPGVARAQVVGTEIGAGESTRVQSLSLDVDWCKICPLVASDHTSLALEFAAFAIQGHRSGEANDNLFALGATPLMRYAWPNRDGTLFVEGGVGVRLLSRTRLYDERRLSTGFQFGELVGVGMRFGARQACEIGVRLQHMSNADIKEPNDGVTFASLRFAVSWN